MTSENSGSNINLNRSTTKLNLEKIGGVNVTKQLFIQTEEQQKWLDKLATLSDSFKARAQQLDEDASFPTENYFST